MTLQDVKVGDKVMLVRRGSEWDNYISLTTAAKIGKVHIVTPSGAKFRILDGRKAGSSGWRSERMEVFDQAKWDEFKKEIALRGLRNQLTDYRWDECPQDIAEKVAALLPVESKEE